MAYKEADIKTQHRQLGVYAEHEDVCHAWQRAFYCPVTHLVFKEGELLTNVDQSCDVWYNNAPMGHNILGCMMSTIQAIQDHANHCVSATEATLLANAGVSTVGIILSSKRAEH